MSLRSRAGRSSRPSRWSRIATLGTFAWITLLLSACSTVASLSATPSQPALGLAASSSGVCAASAALPDRSAAERAFTNLAHQALHGLAADPRLGRSTTAQVLEAMQKVEADFSQSSDVAQLTDDLVRLKAAADAALLALGVEVPRCAG